MLINVNIYWIEIIHNTKVTASYLFPFSQSRFCPGFIGYLPQFQEIKSWT